MTDVVPPVDKLREGRDERILEPDLPIIDAHHHLFDRPHLRYMLDDYLEDAKLGHNIVGSVYIETKAMVRPDGPESLRPVGEVEFANGIGAIGASGVYGQCKVAAAIVGFADMRLGDGIAETLDASLSAAPARFRGIRQIASDHPDPKVLRFLTHRPPSGLLDDPNFGNALRQLGARNLSFDAAILHHQLPALSKWAASHPETTIILNHLGTAVPEDKSPEKKAEAFDIWRKAMIGLANNQNVFCKLSGLGRSYWGFDFIGRAETVGYKELSAVWKPYIEATVGAFGVERCMMASNFPNDGRSCGFVPLWNALKDVAKDWSASEKAALFHGTANRIYKMGLDIQG